MSKGTSQNATPATESICRYFFNLWRRTSVAQKLEFRSEFEEDDEKLSLLFSYRNLHGDKVGLVQADWSAPLTQLLSYFEMSVKNGGAEGHVAIGFTTCLFPYRCQPRWDWNVFGYYGREGLLYRGHAPTLTFGPIYTTGDTVGCGINYATQEFFFTKNGSLGESVPNHIENPVAPTVAVRESSEEVNVNLGEDPFVFNLKGYEAQQEAEHRLKIDNISIPQDASYTIIRDYLHHYGYEETLKLLDIDISVAPENGVTEECSMYEANHRRILDQLIMSGKIDETFSTLHDWYPQILEDESYSTICFLLHCQKFIELVRDGKLEKAVAYSRSELTKFNKSSAYDDLIKECVALLGYDEPSQSSVGYLLSQRQREMVADAVNAIILSTDSNAKDASLCIHSSLHRIVRQITACFLENKALTQEDLEFRTIYSTPR